MEKRRLENYQSNQNQVRNKQDKKSSEIFVRIIIYIIIFYFLFIFMSIIFPSLFPYSNNLTAFIEFIFNFSLFSGVLIFWFLLSIIIIFLASITYFRTKYIGYLFECFISFQNVCCILAVFYILIFNLNSLLFIVLLYGSIIITFLENSYLKKPLFWDKRFTYYQQTYFDQRRDVLFKQAQFVSEFEDGYSSRPVTVDLTDLYDENTNKSFMTEKTVKFGKFLAKKGDLIGYDFTEESNNQTKVKFYLRTGLLQKLDTNFIFNIFWNPFKFLKKIYNVLLKKDLTCITFDFTTNEMSFKLNKFDYEIMDNVTYHLLGENVLNKFKQSLKSFLKEDFGKSYRILFPDDLSYLNLKNI